MIQSRQVEAFRAVMRSGAMTAAAESINVTQPAVSRLIRDLEQELGLTLFLRRGNLVLPTAEARALLVEVDRLFTGLSQIRDFAEGLRTGSGGSLRIAALPAMSAGFLPRFVAKFCRERPNLKVTVEGYSSPVVRDQLTAGIADIGLTAYPFQREALVLTPLNDDAVVAVPQGHRLAAKTVVNVQDLQDENLILLSKFRGGLHPVEQALQPVRSRTRIDTSLSTIACVLASEGAGIAIVDPFSASEFAGRGMVVRRLEPTLTIGTAIARARDRTSSVVAKEFTTAFLEHTRLFLQEARFLSP